MKNIKKYSVESSLSQLFQTPDVQDFLGLGDSLRKVSQCLTGWGVDYNKNKITALKVYYKVFERDLLDISFFTGWFFRDFIQGNQSFSNVLSNASESLLTSRGGLGGVNFAMKAPLHAKPSRAFYIKQKDGSVKVVSLQRGVKSEVSYNYLFNRILIRLLCWRHDLILPRSRHGIEYSIRNKRLFTTVYPNYKLQKGPLIEFFNDLYAEISRQDEWEIEGYIFDAITRLFPPSTPVTKGYVSGNDSRKIFFLMDGT